MHYILHIQKENVNCILTICMYNSAFHVYVHMITVYAHCKPHQIQKQVHPRMDIEDDAILYMEELLYHLLALICSTQPRSIADVASYITKSFVAPINTWALNDAQKTMERHQLRRGKSVFNFPVEKLHPLLEKVPCITCTCKCILYMYIHVHVLLHVYENLSHHTPCAYHIRPTHLNKLEYS